MVVLEAVGSVAERRHHTFILTLCARYVPSLARATAQVVAVIDPSYSVFQVT